VAELVLGGFQGGAGQQAVGGVGVPEPMGGHLLQFRFGVVIGACSPRRVAGSPDDAADGPGGRLACSLLMLIEAMIGRASPGLG
jgi:hypothetical protein